jgi:antirestriction protein ArdC
MSSKQDQIRTEITSRIVESIKSGSLPPWRKSWVDVNDHNSGSASNVVSKKRYTGINPLILQLAAMNHGFNSKWWGTMKQWNDLGARIKSRPDHVPPGHWATQIVYFSPITKKKIDANGVEKEDKFFFLKTYSVFNIDQVEGDLDHLRAGNARLTQIEIDEKFEAAEKAVAAIPVEIVFGGNRACYVPSTDRIHMPHRNCFSTADQYYGVIGHELVHFSESRLNWDRQTLGYAFGELCAEVGSCFWCAELGLSMEDFDQNCSYLKGWLAAMENDHSYIFKAAAQASKAVNFLLGFSRTEEAVNEMETELVA